MNLKTLRIATRQSPLALWQANYVKEMIIQHWPQITVDLIPMVTSGDMFLKDKLLQVGGKGMFVKELEEAILENRADIAVHSTKDMPADLPEGLELTAICKRGNPFDAFVSEHFTSLDSLPPQAIIGTASLRRQSQLLAYRPDLQVKTLRGNVNTRLAKLRSGEYHAIILAAAGLERLGFEEAINETLSPPVMVPACGQGALCIESRANDSEVKEAIQMLNDPTTALCVTTERKVNAQLGGNCHVPLAVYCSVTDTNQLQVLAKLLNTNGSICISSTKIGSRDQASTLAEECAASLLAQGAKDLIQSSLS